MLVLPTFLIFVSLSVAAIPLGPRANGQTPHIRELPLIPAANGLAPAGLDPAGLAKALPIPTELLLKQPNLLGRFIMGADYASSSGPFLKSSHKRQDPGSLPDAPDPFSFPPLRLPLQETPLGGV
jgi:hypothetical protein